MPGFVDGLGFFAAVCTTAAFLPQVLKVLRTHHTRDISLPMYVILIAGIVSWIGYGILAGSWPVILANGTTLILAGTVLLLKIRYG